MTRDEASAIFATDLAPFEAAVAGCTPASLSQNGFDSCVSLAFNIGAHGFVGSTVAHKPAIGDRTGAADAFLLWEHPPEQASRRRAERAQFLRPDAVASTSAKAPVPKAAKTRKASA
ncbi:MAG: lysozyme [Janthinobacterium lividum]